MNQVASPANYVEQYLEPFRAFLTDPATIELAINTNGQVWVEHAGDVGMLCLDGLAVKPDLAANLATTIVGDAQAKVSARNPLVSGKIVYRGRPMRIQVVMPPAVERGASITIRLFSSGGAEAFRPEYLFGAQVSLEELRQQKMQDLRRTATTDLSGALAYMVSSRMNVLFSGGTSTGKTTFARHLLRYVDPGERLVTIEDAIELFPTQPNVVELVAEREADSSRSAARLLEASLRMRPDRIVVGELRGSEALTYLEAINTGHGGSVSTIHAETARLAVDRLAMMVLQAGTPLTFSEVVGYIARSIDVIVQVGRADGRRGVTELFLPSELVRSE